MQKFFENIKLTDGSEFLLSAENAHHCANVLRMTVGEKITVCNGGIDYLCEISTVSSADVKCRVISSSPSASEPSVKVTLYQCLPKGDKLETVIQKSVELGVTKIQPVLSSRCVSRPDEKKSAKKTERYKKIAKSACEQSGRGIIVDVCPTVTFDDALKSMSEEKKIMFYEGGGIPLTEIFKKDSCVKSAAILIGPEGGFSEDEVKKASEYGIVTATLGKRILRTETAPLAALTAIMLLSGNLE